MSAQESQTCMRIPKLCSLQGWKTTQLTLEDSSAQSSNWRAFARAGDSISWSRKRTLRRLRGKGKNCDFLLNLYTHVDIFTYVYSIYAYRITFDYVCARRNEIDPKGPCHIYIYIYIQLCIIIINYIYIHTYVCICIYHHGSPTFSTTQVPNARHAALPASFVLHAPRLIICARTILSYVRKWL